MYRSVYAKNPPSITYTLEKCPRNSSVAKRDGATAGHGRCEKSWGGWRKNVEKGKFLLIYLCATSRVIVNKGNKGIELKKTYNSFE